MSKLTASLYISLDRITLKVRVFLRCHLYLGVLTISLPHSVQNSISICLGANGQFREATKREATPTVELVLAAALGAKLTTERNEIINARTRARTTCLQLQRGVKVFPPSSHLPQSSTPFCTFLAIPDKSRVVRSPNAG